MKITLNLTKAQEKGIADYLKEIEGGVIDKSKIKQFIEGIIDTTLQSPHEAVSDYIKKYED